MWTSWCDVTNVLISAASVLSKIDHRPTTSLNKVYTFWWSPQLSSTSSVAHLIIKSRKWWKMNTLHPKIPVSHHVHYWYGSSTYTQFMVLRHNFVLLNRQKVQEPRGIYFSLRARNCVNIRSIFSWYFVLELCVFNVYYIAFTWYFAPQYST